MKVKVIKDIKTPAGIIRAGQYATVKALRSNGDILLEYNTCCTYGLVKVKKEDYERISKM